MKKKSAILVLLVSALASSTLLINNAHGYFYSPANAGKIFADNNNVIGTYGSSTKYAYQGPAPSTATDPVFYTGIMAHALNTCTDCEGVQSLHITMYGLKPDGSSLSGLEMAPSASPIRGPTSSSNDFQDLLNYIANFILANLPYGLGSGIQNAASYAQSNPAPYGSSSTSSWADWTCNPCENSIGQFDFQDSSLQEAFTLHVDPNLQGTYFLQFIYHVDMAYCSVPGNTFCLLISDKTADYIDNVLYCFVKCSSNNAVFRSETPSTPDTITPSLTQTTYLDSQNPTWTFATSDPIKLGTWYGQQQYSLFGFTLPSLPANSYITSASLQFYVSSTEFGAVCNGPGGKCQMSLSEISSSWSSSSATWNNPPSTIGNQKILFFPNLGQMTTDVTNNITSAYNAGASGFHGFELQPTDTNENWQLSIFSGQSQTTPPTLTVNYITYTSPPSTMCTGQTATVSIDMSNVGTNSLSNWLPTSSGATNPFKLESQNPEGNTNWGISTVELSQTVLYGQDYTFTFNIVAPLTAGTYNFQWRMLQQGVGAFGDYTPNLVVKVATCGDFSVTPNPSSVSLSPGGMTIVGVTMTSLGGFAGTVTVSASPSSPGLIATFYYSTTMTLPSGGTSSNTLQIGANSNAPLGNYVVTVTGASGSLSHATNIAVSVVAPPPPCGCGGGSIAHGSLITMADGSTIPVQNLKIGDKMLGYDTATGMYTVSIVNSINVVDTTNMLIIHTSAGTPFRVDANPRQTLWVKVADGTIGWLPVTQVKVGDDLWTQNGWVKVTSIEFAPAGQHVMYDIFASAPYFADGYLDPVHKM